LESNKIFFSALAAITLNVLPITQANGIKIQIENKESAVMTKYDEQYRPQFHFTPKKNWMNDPNGLIYLDGEYHLFYQHNPFGIMWGHMSWGHAVSKDMLHWKELPVAIPEGEDEGIFSGSAVYDVNNTSGLGTKENPPLVAIYTSSSELKKIQSQSIAFSLDKGRTFKKYSKNPVIDLNLANFRDPKVFWDSEHGNWAMVVVKASEKKVAIFTSPNLISWTHQSDFGPLAAQGGDWECPDLVQLSIDGDKTKKSWVMLVSLNPGGIEGGSGTQYFVGNFDGKSFIPSQNYDNPQWLDYGKDNYAGVTFSNMPDSRTVLIGWMSSWQYAGMLPKTDWTGAMTIPRALELTKNKNGLSLLSTPIKEMKALHTGKTFKEKSVKVKGTQNLQGISGRELDITLTIVPNKTGKSGINVLSGKKEFTQIGYDANSGEIFLNRGTSSLSIAVVELLGTQKVFVGKQKEITLRILVDRSSVEVFGRNGEYVITDVVFPDSKKSDGISLFSDDIKEVIFKELTITKVGSVWR
jgi:fructan beta-fructosidase